MEVTDLKESTDLKERFAVWGGVSGTGIIATILAKTYAQNALAQYVHSNLPHITEAWGRNGARMANSLDELLGVGIVVGFIAATTAGGVLVERYLVPYIKEHGEKKEIETLPYSSEAMIGGREGRGGAGSE